jgi:hypothetical protein
MLRTSFVLSAVVLGLVSAACKDRAEPTPAPTATAVATVQAPAVVVNTARLSRAEFNQRALANAKPMFWLKDANGNGALEPDELRTFWGLDRTVTDETYVQNGKFTAAFAAAYEALVSGAGAVRPSVPSPRAETPDETRRALLRQELSQGRQTMALTDVSKFPEHDKDFVRHIMVAAQLVESLYQEQMGVTQLPLQPDTESRAVFFRNQSPKCEAPQTQANALCFASVTAPPTKPTGLYSQAVSGSKDFCAVLSKHADKTTLMDPFTYVDGTLESPKAVPYTTKYGPQMEAIAKEIDAAYAALAKVATEEAALRTYLKAAATAFRDNNWWPADEAWAKMGVDNSRYYLRIGPDEVYSEPCSTKALFHVSFGLISQASKKWQAKLNPLKQEMEDEIAKLAGAPYNARSVSFKLPDFMDVALNAGDARSPSGATIGQSLPNFGPVANEGRGRTVAMINFYTDEDSVSAQLSTAKSLFCEDTAKIFPSDPEPQLMSTVLHEAAHNLGPAHQYKVKGKVDREVFGGPLASTLEELKAQTAAMHYVEWLAAKNQLTRAEADRAHVADIFWAFGHISRGMYDDGGHPKNYSQLAAIQFGSFLKDGAISWMPKAKAANGTDAGCYQVNTAKMQAAVLTLMKNVAHIKGAGDKAAAEKLLAAYVDAKGAQKEHRDRITERVLRAPKASFVYSVKF